MRVGVRVRVRGRARVRVRVRVSVRVDSCAVHLLPPRRLCRLHPLQLRHLRRLVRVRVRVRARARVRVTG